MKNETVHVERALSLDNRRLSTKYNQVTRAVNII